MGAWISGVGLSCLEGMVESRPQFSSELVESNLRSLVQETSRVTQEASPMEGERRKKKGELFGWIGQQEGRVARTRSREGGFEVGENRRQCGRFE